MKHLKTFNESGYERIIDDDDDFNLDQPHISNKEKDTKFEDWEKEELNKLANQYDYNFDSYRGGKRFYMARRDGMLSIQMWKLVTALGLAATLPLWKVQELEKTAEFFRGR